MNILKNLIKIGNKNFMDKFLYFTDFHYGSNPVSRKDNYNESLLSKLTFVLKLARKNGCTILNGGDLFDKPNIKMTDMLALMSILNDFSDVRFISLRGNNNHDGHIEQSPLRLLELSGLIETSDGKEYVDFPESRIHFADNNTNPNDSIKEYADGKLNILMTHHILVQNATIYDHYLISELKTKADMILIADYHPRQGIITREDGKVFISPGACARRKHTAHEINRVPKCVYIKSDGKIKELDIPVSHDIWSNVDKIEEVSKVDSRTEVETMMELIDEDGMFDINIEGMIQAFAKTVKLNEETLDYILNEFKKL